MYTVNDLEFVSFSEAVKVAAPIRAEVFEKSTGIRRWSPAPLKTTKRTVHVLINADGSETPFSKVSR